MTLRTSRRCEPGWSGSLPCRATCRPPVRVIQRLLLIESTDEASGREGAERTPSIVAVDRMAKALGTSLAERFMKLDNDSALYSG